MPKVSRQLFYTVFGMIVVGGAAYYYTMPDTTTTTHIAHHTRLSSAVDADGITSQDLNAHFARYVGGKRDPFVPIVSLADTSSASHDRGGWQLTGINSVNGVQSALLENGGGDTIFLQPGDKWNGLKVASIGSDTVTFANALGQQTVLTFADNENLPPPGASGTQAANSRVPSLNEIRPLPTLQTVAPSAPAATAAPAQTTINITLPPDSAQGPNQ